jgi:hypothetical protein
MIYLNNFIPVRIYYCKKLDVYRLMAPLADRSNLEYNEDFIKNKLLPTSYELIDTVYVLNPRLFPPVPLGAVMFSVYQDDNFPYHTKYVEWIAFPVMTNVFHERGNFSFYAFINSPAKDALSIYIRNEKNRTMVSLDQKAIADYFLTTPYYKKALDRDNFVVYIFSHPYLYWRATAECLCVPSGNPKDYPTLVECQRNTYHKIKNSDSYTGNSAIPLAEMRDQIFPVYYPNIYKYSYLTSVVIICVFLFFIYKLKKK